MSPLWCPGQVAVCESGDGPAGAGAVSGPVPAGGWGAGVSGVIRGEQEMLGELLLSRTAVASVVDVFHIEYFRCPAHRLIYGCILDLYQRGQPADPVTVSAELDRCGDLFSAGGARYLHTLISLAPSWEVS